MALDSLENFIVSLSSCSFHVPSSHFMSEFPSINFDDFPACAPVIVKNLLHANSTQENFHFVMLLLGINFFIIKLFSSSK